MTVRCAIIAAVLLSAETAHACPMRQTVLSKTTILALMALVLWLVAFGFADDHDADSPTEAA